MSDMHPKRSPDDFDWPATIVLYAVLIILGVGMCFCLRQANRLIPNRFSFPLIDRGEGRQRFDVSVEEEGLLSNYNQQEEEEEEEPAATVPQSRYDEDDDEEEFGALQKSPPNQPL